MAETHSNEKGVRRFDVACILEETIGDLNWKGEQHSNGIFFTDTHSYVISKTLIAKTEHAERAAEVFYSFAVGESDENKVTKDYPFKGLNANPKHYHLLFEQKEVSGDSLDHLFSFPKNKSICFHINSASVLSMIGEVKNKRERERTRVTFSMKENALSCRMTRKRHHQFVLDVKSSFEVDDLIMPTDSPPAKYILNGHMLYCTLKIFKNNSRVTFHLSHDRILITGNLSTREGDMSLVEVVLSLVKER